MADLDKTPLYDLHISLNARMVDFAGYQMAVQYPLGIIKEVQHCRKKVGLFDVSHMGQFELSLNAAPELDVLIPGSVSKLTTGQQLYNVLTNAAGGIIDDIIITRLASRFLMVVNASCKDKDFRHLQSHLSSQSALKRLDQQALLALQGPLAEQVMQKLCPDACELSFMTAVETTIDEVPCVISRCGYTGEDGFEISIANNHVETLARQLLSFEDVMPIGLGARDILRLEAGLSLYGHELTESTTPVEAGLKWLLTDNKPYLGSEAIVEQQLHGAAKRKIGLVVEGRIPVRTGAELRDATAKTVGVITSGAFSPTLNRSIAIALIDSGCTEQSFTTQIRNHQVKLKANTLPFVTHRYYRNAS